MGFFSKGDGGRGAEIASAKEHAAKIAKLYEGIDIPDIEKQRLALEEGQLAGMMSAEQLADTQLGQVKTDPRYKAAQMAALQQYQDMSRTGLGMEDRLAYQELSDRAAAQDTARRQSILAAMTERGALDSGESLAAQLQGAQATRTSQEAGGRDLAAQAIQARRAAIESAAGLGGRMQQQDYDQEANIARSRDAINQFNATNRQTIAGQNLSERQRMQDANQNLRNTQQQFNKGLYQQQFGNQMQKAGGIAGGFQAQANVASSAAASASPGQSMFDKVAGVAGAVGGGLSGAGTLMKGISAYKAKEE